MFDNLIISPKNRRNQLPARSDRGEDEERDEAPCQRRRVRGG